LPIGDDDVFEEPGEEGSEEGAEEGPAKPKPFGMDMMKGRKMGLLSSTQTRDRTVSGRTVSGVSGAIPTWIFPKLLIISQNCKHESNELKSLIHAQFF
jgi:hypothetical protein